MLLPLMKNVSGRLVSELVSMGMLSFFFFELPRTACLAEVEVVHIPVAPDSLCE